MFFPQFNISPARIATAWVRFLTCVHVQTSMRTSLLTVFPFVKVRIERTDVDMRNFELPAKS